MFDIVVCRKTQRRIYHEIALERQKRTGRWCAFYVAFEIFERAKLFADLFHKFRFQAHRPDAWDLAIDIVIAFNKADVFNLRAHFNNGRRALNLQILDDRNGIAIRKRGAVGITNDIFRRRSSRGRPFMGAFWANQQFTIFVGVSRLAFGAGW